MSKETALFQDVSPAVYLLARVADRHFDARKTADNEWWKIHTRRNPRRTEDLDRQRMSHSELFDEVNEVSSLIPSLGAISLTDFEQFAAKSGGAYNPKILPGKAERAIRQITGSDGEIELDTAKYGTRPFYTPGLDEPWAGEPAMMRLMVDGKIDLDTLYRIYEAGTLFKLARLEKRTTTARFIADFIESKIDEVFMRPTDE